MFSKTGWCGCGCLVEPDSVDIGWNLTVRMLVEHDGVDAEWNLTVRMLGET